MINKNRMFAGILIGLLLSGTAIFAVTAVQYGALQMESELNKLLQKAETKGLSTGEVSLVNKKIASFAQYNPKKAEEFKKKFEKSFAIVGTEEPTVFVPTEESKKIPQPKVTELEMIEEQKEKPTHVITVIEKKSEEPKIEPKPTTGTKFLIKDKPTSEEPKSEPKPIIIVESKGVKKFDTDQLFEEMDKIKQSFLFLKNEPITKRFSRTSGFYYWFLERQKVNQRIAEMHGYIDEDVEVRLDERSLELLELLVSTLSSALYDLFEPWTKKGSFLEIHTNYIHEAFLNNILNFLTDFYGSKEKKNKEQQERWDELQSFSTILTMLEKSGIKEIFEKIHFRSSRAPEIVYDAIFNLYRPTLAQLVYEILQYIIVVKNLKNQPEQEKIQDEQDYFTFFDPLYQVLVKYDDLFESLMPEDKTKATFDELAKMTDEFFGVKKQ